MGKRKIRVRIEDVKPSPAPFHDTLDPSLEERAERVKERLRGVYGDEMTSKEWVDGFRYDLHPDREIGIWEKIAEMCDEGRTLAERRAIFRKAISLSVGAHDDGTIEVSIVDRWEARR